MEVLPLLRFFFLFLFLNLLTKNLSPTYRGSAAWRRMSSAGERVSGNRGNSSKRATGVVRYTVWLLIEEEASFSGFGDPPVHRIHDCVE